MKLPKGLKLPPGEVAIAVRVDAASRTMRVATASGKVLRFRYDAAEVYEQVVEHDAATGAGAVPQHVQHAREAAAARKRAAAAAKQAAREAQEQQPQPQPSGGGGGKPQPGGDGGKPPPPSKPRDYTAEEWIELATARFDEWDASTRVTGGMVTTDDIQCACKHGHHIPPKCWNVADVRALIYESVPRNYCEPCAMIALRDFTALLKRDPILQEGDIIT